MLLIGVPQVAAMTIQHHDTNTKIDTSYTCVFMRAISYTDGTVCAINDAAEPTYQPVSNVSDQTPRLLNDEHVGDAYITSDDLNTHRVDVATNMGVSDVSAAGFFERTTPMFTPWGAL